MSQRYVGGMPCWVRVELHHAANSDVVSLDDMSETALPTISRCSSDPLQQQHSQQQQQQQQQRQTCRRRQL